jgi:hypothetical protein
MKYIEQKPNTAPQKLCMKNGMVPAAVLTRNTTDIQRNNRDQIIQDLLDAEIIGTTEAHGNICYFRKSFD